MSVITESSNNLEHSDRWSVLVRGTLYSVLPRTEKIFVMALAKRYSLTVQEMRILCEASRDLEMWGEPGLATWWPSAEQIVVSPSKGRSRKHKLLSELTQRLEALRRSPTRYPKTALKPQRRPLKVEINSSEQAVFGDCPVRSERTLCCNLKTIDAVKNCSFGCSYCTIQTFYGDRVSVDADLGAKLRNLDIEPGRFYHIGSGQSSDSLVWGNKHGILDHMCAFAAKQPDVLLELKTKSANVAYFLDSERHVPSNLVCSWSLNTAEVIKHEEHFTARLDQRLRSARRVADRGIKVAFHFHPMVHYKGWEDDYPALAERILKEFSPDEVSFISIGSVTFIKPVIKQIRRRGEPTRILQTTLVKDPHGKLTYPDELKVKMFGTMYRALTPWHNQVFMYLCMEKPENWDRSFGWKFDSNEEFERVFAASTLYRHAG